MRLARGRQLALSLAVVSLSLGSGGVAFAAQPVTTIHMVYWPGPESVAMSHVIKSFNATVGKADHFRVGMDLFSRTTFWGKENSILAAHSNSEDIMFTASYYVGAMTHYLVPLGNLLPKASQAIYLPAALDSLKVGGHLYAIPMDVSNHFLFYRQDLMHNLLTHSTWKARYTRIAKKELGVALVPKEPALWHWRDFEATALFFTKSVNPMSPIRYGVALQLKNLIYNIMIWDDVLWSYGGHWYTNGKPALESPAAKKAMQVYMTLVRLHATPPDSTTYEYPQTQAALRSGDVAMALQWSAAYEGLTNPKKSPKVYKDIAIAPIPGPVHRTHVHALAVSISRFSLHRKDDLVWLHYLASVPAMKVYALNGGLPPVGAVLNAPALVKDHPEYPAIAEQIRKYGFSETVNANTPAMLTVLANNLSAAWAKQVTPSQALKQANTQLAPLYK